MQRTIAIGSFLILMVALAVACKREAVRVYNVAKEAGETPHIHWQLPTGWEEKPLSGMRVGSFRVKGENNQEADVSIITAGGSELDNVNRWRAQVGLEPVLNSQLPSLAEGIAIGAAQGNLYDLLGTNPESRKPERMLAATLAASGSTWFFKMIGPDALVTSQKQAFREFLKSIKFHDAGHGDALASSGQPAEASAARSDPASPGLPQWEVPSNWKQSPPSAMLLARFTMSDAQSGQAELTVSAFPGDVGGLLANLNRWRGQIELPPVPQGELANLTTSLEVNGKTVTLVDVVNPNRQNDADRILTAVWPHQGQTWFFKLMGKSAVIEKEKPAFIKFIQSIRFPNA